MTSSGRLPSTKVVKPRKSAKKWARLIQKIYEVDPLTCPKCSGVMKVISVIEDEEIIKKIFKHLGLWDRKARPPPKAAGPPKVQDYSIDYSVSQLPESTRRMSDGSGSGSSMPIKL